MTSSSFKEIGGYFGLELYNNIYENTKDDVILLNTARNCLRYVIRSFKITEIHVPYYTCPVIWQAAQNEHCKVNFYHINNDFFPEKEFKENDYILYTNYFGVCSKNVKKLSDKYKNLVVDNAQAFYMPKYGIASFNSLRKFFGTTDGAVLHCDKKLTEKFVEDNSYQRFSHLLKRVDVNADFGYPDFCKNENYLNDEPIKYMSNLTKTLFNRIDINFALKKRIENFNILSGALLKTNKLSLNLDENDIPMVYPYFTEQENLKEILIKNKIYIPTYWNPLPIEYKEGLFQKYLIPLPIDQRYKKNDMERILEVING